MRRRVLGAEHASTLASQANLATTLRPQGKIAEATAMHREVSAGLRSAVGPDHPDAVASLNNLAMSLAAQGEYAEAEALPREALERTRTRLGLEHLTTLNIKNNLASILVSQGRHSEAAVLLQEVSQGRRGRLGPDHPQTKASLQALKAAEGRHSGVLMWGTLLCLLSSLCATMLNASLLPVARPHCHLTAPRFSVGARRAQQPTHCALRAPLQLAVTRRRQRAHCSMGEARTHENTLNGAEQQCALWMRVRRRRY